jgi:protein phosphatase 1 regulatory subunit 10
VSSSAVKKRTIKRLDRPSQGSTSLLDSLLRGSNKVSPKSKEKDTKATTIGKTTSPEKKKQDTSPVSRPSSSPSSSSPPPTLNLSSKQPETTMALPTIQSFGAASSGSATSSTKRIRWADEAGGELEKIKLIESWRDQPSAYHHVPEGSFKDAKLREHEDERIAMKHHKEMEQFHVVPTHEWSMPPFVKLPQNLASRRNRVKTEEISFQDERTRREMEYLVLDGEIPPVSPKEWTRNSNESSRNVPLLIPLSDVSTHQYPSVSTAYVLIEP